MIPALNATRQNVIKNMKYTKKIIGPLLILILTANIGIPLIYADTESELTEPEQECTDEKKLLEKAYLMESWNEAQDKNEDDYKEAFEKMQTTYHDYIGCIFNFAESEILLEEEEIDWMNPDQACLDPIKLKEVMGKSEPKQMLGPILQAHADYKKYLYKLGYEFDSEGDPSTEDNKLYGQLEMLKARSENIGTLQRQRQMEIDSSLLAVDLMFTSLKELRLSFVMHVQFQCTLKFLDKYMKALENLRNVIEPLPDQLEDASIS